MRAVDLCELLEKREDLFNLPVQQSVHRSPARRQVLEQAPLVALTPAPRPALSDLQQLARRAVPEPAIDRPVDQVQQAGLGGRVDAPRDPATQPQRSFREAIWAPSSPKPIVFETCAEHRIVAARARRSRVLTMARTDRTWHYMFMDATLVLGQQGRLVIPADVRNALGLSAGDRLHLHLTGQRLVLERQEDAAAELRGLASDVPRTRSLVDELLAERRAAAAAE